MQKSACILCSINCGIEVQLEGRRLSRIHGDREHPGSRGYTCEKALRLDHYQSGQRLTSPLRRRPDGSFEAIPWDEAIREVAARFAALRDTHGGESIFYYGGGGQGNHLGGAYGRATRAALGSVFTSNALAQEKTGEFWVDGRLYGRPRCHTSGDFEHAEVAVFVGKNPWHSHGFPRARAVLREIARDPARALIVIDPRRSETAELADIHLQVRPGGDAFCLSALLAVLVEEDLLDHAFLQAHASNLEPLLTALRAVPIAAHCESAGVPEEQVRAAARRIARASSVSTFEDLGVQQTLHSTLNSYLEKLLYLLTGNFARRGAMNIHSRFASLGGGGGGGARTAPVGGHRVITGLIPANVIPDEILTDHPRRFRGILVESANPAHSLADSQRMRAALGALDLLVVIDVAMTETARLAHYVLPASSQFEKWEATFFNLEFPRNVFQLRAPLMDALPGTLPEAEIHRRLVRALGALDGDIAEDIQALHEAAGRGRADFAMTYLQRSMQRPRLAALAPVVLYETMGPLLPAGAAEIAAVWGLAHTCAFTFGDSVRRAGFQGEGLALGEALFDAILQQRSGVVFSVDDYAETWRRVETADGRVNLAIPELLEELQALRPPAPPPPEYPLVLSAGERRSSTANTIFRDPAWRKKDVEGALRISPEDAARLCIADGGLVQVTTKRGSVRTRAEVSDTLRPGHVSLPNGQGLTVAQAGGDALVGAPANELTASEDRDWLAGTPWHKHLHARVEALPAG